MYFLLPNPLGSYLGNEDEYKNKGEGGKRIRTRLGLGGALQFTCVGEGRDQGQGWNLESLCRGLIFY